MVVWMSNKTGPSCHMHNRRKQIALKPHNYLHEMHVVRQIGSKPPIKLQNVNSDFIKINLVQHLPSCHVQLKPNCKTEAVFGCWPSHQTESTVLTQSGVFNGVRLLSEQLCNIVSGNWKILEKTNLSNLFMLETWFLSPFYCWRKDKLDRRKSSKGRFDEKTLYI